MGCKHVESKKHSNGQPDVVANKPVKAEPQKKEIQEVTVDDPEKKAKYEKLANETVKNLPDAFKNKAEAAEVQDRSFPYRYRR